MIEIIVPELFNKDLINEWKDVSNRLELVKCQTVYIKIAGGGGKLYILKDIITSIKKCHQHKNYIIAKITGEAISSHAFLAAYADRIFFEPNSSLIFHHAFIEKKFLGLIKYRSLTINPAEEIFQEEIFQRCLAVGVLDDNDIEKIRNGKTIIKREI